MSSKTAHLKSIADSTIETVRRGFIEDPHNRITHPLKSSIADMLRGTRYYDHYNPHLMNWKQLPQHPRCQENYVHVEALKLTTLEGLRYLQSDPSSQRAGKCAILNFASGTRPGGGFRSGASAQEETLARSSTLFKALESDAMKVFYDKHNHTGDPFYSHAMIYSPHVVFFRDDNGGWVVPTEADVLTCAAVNAKRVRESHGHAKPEDVERWIRENMHERMGRLLELFEYRRARNLVLGSFGTGVFQNDVEMVARVWRALLFERDARFRFSFHRVVFAIPDPKTLATFKKAFFDSHHGHGSSRY